MSFNIQLLIDTGFPYQLQVNIIAKKIFGEDFNRLLNKS